MLKMVLFLVVMIWLSLLSVLALQPERNIFAKLRAYPLKNALLLGKRNLVLWKQNLVHTSTVCKWERDFAQQMTTYDYDKREIDFAEIRNEEGFEDDELEELIDCETMLKAVPVRKRVYWTQEMVR